MAAKYVHKLHQPNVSLATANIILTAVKHVQVALRLLLGAYSVAVRFARNAISVII